MNFQIDNIDVLNGEITYVVDGTEVVEPLTLAALINVIINFINAILRNEES